MIISIFVLFSFQIADTYFIGLLGTAELAAISFTIPVTQSVTNVAVGLGIGTSIMIAKSIGQGNARSAARTATNALMLTAFLAIGISIAGLLSVNWLFTQLGASPPTIILIHDYIDIWFWGVVLLLAPFIASGSIRATGDTKWSSFVMVCSGLLNVILDPLLIFGLGPFPQLGIKGAAIATLCAGIFNVIVFGWMLYYREKLLLLSFPGVRPFMIFLKTVTLLCLPIVLANILRPFLDGIVTAIVAQNGEAAVAGFGAGSRFEMLANVVAFALTAALSPFIAQNLGAGQHRRARTALKSAMIFVSGFYLALWVLIFFLSPVLGLIFSDDPAVIESTRLYLLIMPASFVFYGVFIVANTGFNSAQQSMKTLIVSLVRVFICVAPAVWIGNSYYGLTGLFWGAVVGGGLASLVALIWLVKVYSRDIETAQTNA